MKRKRLSGTLRPALSIAILRCNPTGSINCLSFIEQFQFTTGSIIGFAGVGFPVSAGSGANKNCLKKAEFRSPTDAFPFNTPSIHQPITPFSKNWRRDDTTGFFGKKNHCASAVKNQPKTHFFRDQNMRFPKDCASAAMRNPRKGLFGGKTAVFSPQLSAFSFPADG